MAEFMDWFAIHVDSREEMRALEHRNFVERQEIDRKKTTDFEMIRCKDCRFNDPTERDKAVEWLPCMSVKKPSSWFCGSAERKTNGRS